MGKLKAMALVPHAAVQLDDYPLDCAWSSDGRQLALAGGEGGVFLAAQHTDGRWQARRLGNHGMGALAVSWRPGSAEFASAGQDSTVASWDATSGLQLWRSAPGRQWVEKLAWRPDAALLASSAARQQSLWSASGTLQHAPDPVSASINALCWDAAGADLAAAMHGGIVLTRLESGSPRSRTLPWAETCLAAAFSPNSKFLAAGSQDGSVHFWYLMTRRDSQMRGYPGKVDCLSWSANSRYLATNAGNDIVIWDFSGKGPEGSRPLQLRGHTDKVTALAFQPAGPYLASAGRDWRLSLWQPGKAQLAMDAQLSDAEVTLLRFSPDGSRLAVGEASGRLSLFELVMMG